MDQPNGGKYGKKGMRREGTWRLEEEGRRTKGIVEELNNGMEEGGRLHWNWRRCYVMEGEGQPAREGGGDSAKNM
jgi:hypothetical protein